MSNRDNNSLLTAREACQLLGVSRFTLGKYIASGLLKAHKLGGNGKSHRHWRIWQHDLESFVAGVTQ